MRTQTRVGAGVPTGGQFATSERAEATVSLADETDLDPTYEPYLPHYDDAAYDEMLTFLRSKIDPLDDGTSDEMDPRQRAEAARSLRAVKGTDLPPMMFAHHTPLDREKFTYVTNSNHPKPDGGLWFSPGEPGGRSVWQGYLDMTGYDHSGGAHRVSAQPVALRDTARVLVIDTRDDLLAVNRLFPGPAPEHPEFQDPSPIDYEALAENFDAIWLTDNGRAHNHRHYQEPDLYGWDFESVLVLNPSAVDWP